MRNRVALNAIFYFAAIAWVRDAPAMPPQRGDQVLVSAPGPFLLSPAPLEISLHGDFSLPATVARLSPTERMYLVLREIGANEQPGVVYRIYLGGAAETKKADPMRLLGTVNFFNAVAIKDEKPGARPGATRSIDITEVLRKLQKANNLPERVTVTIQPSGAPAPTAKPVIGRVDLVISR